MALGEPDRRLDHHLAEEVSGIARAQPLDALAAQAKDLPGLGLGRHLHLGRAVERRDLDLAAEGGLRKADRHLAVQVVAIALKHPVRPEMDDDVEVAGRSAVHAGLALAGEANAIALVHAGRNLDREGLVALDAPGAAARGAGVGHHLARAVAGRARLLDREEALREAHRARAVAGLACLRLRAGFRAGPAARVAGLHRRDADLGLGAARRLLERDLEVVAQVRAAIDRRAAARAAAEDVAEDVAERVGEAAEAGRFPRAHAHVRMHARVPVGVVGAPLVRVGQDLVGFLRLLELLLAVLAVRIAVGVVLHRKLAISLLDLVLGGVPVDACSGS